MIKTILEDYEAKEENINIDDEYDKIFSIQKDYPKKVIFLGQWNNIRHTIFRK